MQKILIAMISVLLISIVTVLLLSNFVFLDVKNDFFDDIRLSNDNWWKVDQMPKNKAWEAWRCCGSYSRDYVRYCYRETFPSLVNKWRNYYGETSSSSKSKLWDDFFDNNRLSNDSWLKVDQMPKNKGWKAWGCCPGPGDYVKYCYREKFSILGDKWRWYCVETCPSSKIQFLRADNIRRGFGSR